MSVEQMKAAILWVYPGWYTKVSKMSDGQVLAIYTRMLNQGKLANYKEIK
jgi:hypothetical protein